MLGSGTSLASMGTWPNALSLGQNLNISREFMLYLGLQLEISMRLLVHRRRREAVADRDNRW